MMKGAVYMEKTRDYTNAKNALQRQDAPREAYEALAEARGKKKKRSKGRQSNETKLAKGREYSEGRKEYNSELSKLRYRGTDTPEARRALRETYGVSETISRGQRKD